MAQLLKSMERSKHAPSKGTVAMAMMFRVLGYGVPVLPCMEVLPNRLA